MKLIYIVFFFFFFISCNNIDPDEPCKIDGLDGRVCIEVYEPVCGCNNQTYSNSCYAQSAGITSWTDGECSG